MLMFGAFTYNIWDSRGEDIRVGNGDSGKTTRESALADKLRGGGFWKMNSWIVS